MELLQRRLPGLGAAALAAAILVLGSGLLPLPAGSSPAAEIPAPLQDSAKQAGPVQSAVLAGGCFWGVEGVFEHVRGVRDVRSGYSGGDADSASYDLVSSGKTRHAESVQIDFDPEQISFGEILRIYFSVAHDPTQVDRQGPDVGPQYRSVIFYADESQKKIAQSYIEQLNTAKVFKRPIATRVDALDTFHAAEAYHQNFMARNPKHRYIVYHDLPKVQNLKRLFPEVYVEDPITGKSESAK